MPVRTWLLLGAFLLLWNLKYAPFWNPDEGRYSSAALEMAHPFAGEPFAGEPPAGDWTVPHLNTIPRLNKPPLVYWLGAISYKILGVSEIAARLVPALAALAVMLGLYFLARAPFGERVAVAAALVWATSLLPAGLGRVFNTDMLLTASIFFACGGIFLAGEERSCRYSRVRPYLWAGGGMGLALLAKGPVGVALPLLIGAVYLTLARRWKFVSPAGVLGAIVLMLLIGAPWYFALEAREPGFARKFLIEENLGRFSGSQEYHDKRSPMLYIWTVLLGVMPWSAFWLAAAARGWELRKQHAGTAAQRLQLFSWIWGLLLVGFFSASSTKLISYVLPAFPAFALLIGGVFDGEWQWHRDIRHWALGTATALNLVVAAAVGVYLSNNRTVPLAVGLPFALAAAAILTGMTVALWKWQRDRWKLFCGQLIGAFAFLTMALALSGRIAQYEDASPMFVALAPHLEADDKIVEYRTFQPSAIFYFARPVTMLDFVNNSGLDEKDPNFARLFRPSAEIEPLRRSPQRVFALAKWSHKNFDNPEKDAFSKWKLIGHNNDFRLYCNREAPAGFRYDFTAPGKRDRLNP